MVFEHIGRNLRVTTHHQDRLVANLAATGLKKRGTFQITQGVESHQTAPPVKRFIIHSISAGKQFELRKSGATVSRKETCCQKKFSLKEVVLERKQRVRKEEGKLPS